MPKNESEEARQHRLAMHRIHGKKYRESENGKRVMAEYAKKYKNTEHGKKVVRKCIDKYRENHVCIKIATHNRVWFPEDSLQANLLRLIKQEFRTPELVKSLRDPDIDMVLLMNLTKKLIPYNK